MFDFLVIIFFIVVAIVTSSKKDKTNQDVDLDFQDLASLDDFFKSKTSGQSKRSMPSLPPTRSSSNARTKAPRAQRSKQFSASPEKRVDRRSHSSANDTFHRSNKAKESFEARNVSSTERASRANQRHDEEQAHQTATDKANARAEFYSLTSKSKFSLQREDLVKSFILSEVMTRYNLNRIYDRIPDFKDD